MLEAIMCPSVEDYRRLVSGQVQPEEEEQMLAHLEACTECAEVIGTLPEADTLVDLVQQAGASGEGNTPEPVAQLVQELSQLRPEGVGRKSPRRAEDGGSKYGGSRAEGTAREEKYDWLAPAQVEGDLGSLGPYRVLGVLGSGGMGVVFRAWDPHLERDIALKAMHPARAVRASARQRFLREARATAAIKHDHIVSVYQVGEDQGVPFLAMELLEGESLARRLEREGKLAVEEVRRIGREIALGLSAAHARELIHRDIKPDNIWLEGETGRVKILDFGLALADWEENRLTVEGAIVGTPGYMAPEQAQGQSVDARSDLFSLGCVLYRMVTGEQPFQEMDLVSTLLAVSTHAPPAPAEVDAGISQELSELIMGLLEKEPEQRPRSAEAVAQALEQKANSPETGGTERKPARGRRRWIGAVVAACLVLAGLTLAWNLGTLRLKTKEGVIVLEGLPANAEILVDGAKAKVRYGPDGNSIEVQVAPGERKLLIQADGFVAKTEDVVLESGDRKPIRIRLEPIAAEAKPVESKVEASGTKGYVSLFDGEKLVGMEQSGNPIAEWKVEKGILIGRWPPFARSPGGSHLFTQRKDYRNFRFRVETTLCENWACSMVFGWKKEVFPKTWYRVNIGSSSGRDVLATGTLKRSFPPPIEVTPNPKVRFRDGEWFRQEVVVEGRQIQVYVNDGLRLRYLAKEPPEPGHVGIALSGQSSIRIRKLEVKDLGSGAESR